MSYNILICDDERDIVSALKIYLEAEGYRTFAAANGREALAILDREDIHLVLLDIMMPVMDGVEALRRMRDEGNDVPVLLLTAKAEVRDRVAGLDAGADDYLTKPFAMEELLARLRSLIRRGTPGTPDTVRLGDMVLDTRQGILKCVNSIALVSRETELLALLMRSTDRDLKESEILSRVWKDFAGADAETLKLYVRYINGKLLSVGACFRVERRPGGMRLCREAEK